MQENENKNYDLIIVGGGPAGASAAVYAARKQMKTLLVLKDWGGQSIVSDDIQNWIGTPHISGSDLAKSFRNHVEEYSGEFLTIKTGSVVNSLEKTEIENSELNKITLEDGKEFLGKCLLIVTGSVRRKLDVPGAELFDHKGLTYCATCDGPMYSDMDVVVVGGGNAGFESAAQLLAYCKSVTLLSRGEPRADKITIDKLKANTKFKLITGACPTEIHGNKFVDSISYSSNNEITKLEAGGIFVEIGQIPATAWCKNVVCLDEYGKIKINPWTQKCVDENNQDLNNIWSAGDCTNILYHQNNIASGDAVRAVEDIYKTLHAK
jgi:NADH-dependent peroxiredoxin subunit F